MGRSLRGASTPFGHALAHRRLVAHQIVPVVEEDHSARARCDELVERLDEPVHHGAGHGADGARSKEPRGLTAELER
ncbi:MAG: hypothetical protein ACK56I_16245, partial [bacterium]